MTKYPRADDLAFVVLLARCLGAGYGAVLEEEHSRRLDSRPPPPVKHDLLDRPFSIG